MTLEALPNAEAIRYFEGKGYRTGFHWQDVWQQEHARAFTVAKVMRYDLLEDIRRAVDMALRDGQTFAQFKDSLMPQLARRGWTGFQDVLDPLTGTRVRAELGTPRRLRIIYDTNLRMANAAGRWARFERTAASLPILVYRTRADERVRESHAPWHEVALRIEDPFWDTHYPPNGWNCRCTVTALSERAARRRGLDIGNRPAVETRPFINKRTGERTDQPVGIDPGFAYNVGRAHMRGLTPPPTSGPLTPPRLLSPAPPRGSTRGPAPTPPADHPAMPAARPAPLPVLPAGVTPDAAVDAFLGHFGASRTRPVVIKDPLGEPVVIDQSFFFRRSGHSKLLADDRRRNILLYAALITDPDEIWWMWEYREKLDIWALRKRYMARFETEEGAQPLLVAMDTSTDGWRGVTAFTAKSQDYLLRQRGGTLAWRRP